MRGSWNLLDENGGTSGPTRALVRHRLVRRRLVRRTLVGQRGEKANTALGVGRCHLDLVTKKQRGGETKVSFMFILPRSEKVCL